MFLINANAEMKKYGMSFLRYLINQFLLNNNRSFLRSRVPRSSNRCEHQYLCLSTWFSYWSSAMKESCEWLRCVRGLSSDDKLRAICCIQCDSMQILSECWLHCNDAHSCILIPWFQRTQCFRTDLRGTNVSCFQLLICNVHWLQPAFRAVMLVSKRCFSSL